MTNFIMKGVCVDFFLRLSRLGRSAKFDGSRCYQRRDHAYFLSRQFTVTLIICQAHTITFVHSIRISVLFIVCKGIKKTPNRHTIRSCLLTEEQE